MGSSATFLHTSSAPPAPVSEDLGTETLRAYAREAFDRWGDRIALVTERERRTFRELGDRVRRIANLLDHLGAGPDDIVGSLVSPRPEIFYEMWLAKAEHGAALFGLSPGLLPEDMTKALRSVRPKVVVYDGDHFPKFPALLEKALPGARAVAARGPLGDFEGLLPRMSSVESRNPISGDSLAAIGYTSGTTGRPKGITMTNRAVAVSCRMLLDSMPGSEGPQRFLTGIPIFAAGSGMIVPCLMSGRTNVIYDRFDADRAVASIEQDGIESTFLTPSMLIDLLDVPGLDRRELSSLKRIVYGSANTPVPKLEEGVRRLGPIFLQGYGMSELLPPVAVLFPEEHGADGHPAGREILSSVGRPVAGVTVRIAAEDGTPVPVGEAGEILISSPTVTAGYWRDPERTANSFHQGFWRSSDAGYLDLEGRLHVIDRKADVLSRRGRAIYPRYVEEACHDHPMVKEAAAVQKTGSEHITVAVSPRRKFRAGLDTERFQQQVMEFVTARLSQEDLPDQIVVFPEIPRSLQGKVLKREVRDALTARES